MKDMLSNWLATRDIVLAVKAKMAKINTHLTDLDNTFAWNCMVGKARHVGLGDDSSGSATVGR